MKDYKKKVKENVKKYTNKEYLDNYIKEEFLTEDGDADIFIKLNSKDSLFDSRTIGKQIDLNEHIYEFVEEKSSMLDCDIHINLHLIGLDLTEEEKSRVKRILKEHYAIELYKNHKEYNKNKKDLIILLSLGLIAFLIYALLYFLTNFNFALEVFCFLFSFAIWEGCDYYIYTFREIVTERNNINQNLMMSVDFSL